MGPSDSLREHGSTEHFLFFECRYFLPALSGTGEYYWFLRHMLFLSRLKFFTNLVHARIFIVIYIPFKHSGYY